MASHNIPKNKGSIPSMIGDLRQPVEAIADALLAQGEELKQPTASADAHALREDLERCQALTPALLRDFYVVREQHRPLDRIIKAYTQTIKAAMGELVYYTADGWEVVLGEQPRQQLDRERLIRDFREVYDSCQHMIVARILNVIPPKGFQG